MQKYYDEINIYLEKFDKEKIKEYILCLGKDDNIYRKISEARQKKLNSLMLSDMVKLKEAAEKEGIRYIFVKGLTLAAEVYERPKKRFFGDIDMYVHTDDLRRFVAVLGEMGYKDPEGNTVCVENFKKYDYPSHLSPFTNPESGIVLEVHVIPFFLNSAYPMLLDTENNYDLFSYIVQKEFFGHKFNVLEENMCFMYILDHFIKHIVMNTVGYFKNYDESLNVSMSKLFEAKLYYEKNKDAIDNEKLKKIAADYCIRNSFRLGLKWLNEVFPGTLDLEIDPEPGGRGMLYENKLCRFYEDIRLSEVIENRSNKEWLDGVIAKNGYAPGLRLKVPFRSPHVSGIKFSMAEEQPGNYWGTHRKRGGYGNWPNGMEDRSLSGTAAWDYEKLYLNFYINDSVFPEYHGNILVLKVAPYEGERRNEFFDIYIRTLNHKKGSEYEFYDLVKSNGGDISEKCFFMYSAIPGFGYGMHLELTWDVLEVKPEEGNILRMDIHFPRYDENGQLVFNQVLSCIAEEEGTRSYAEMILSGKKELKEEEGNF